MMTPRQSIDECSRRLDVLSRRAARAAYLFATDQAKAKTLLDELSLEAFRISSTLESISKS